MPEDPPMIVEWVLKTHRPLLDLVMKHLNECRGCSLVEVPEENPKTAEDVVE